MTASAWNNDAAGLKKTFVFSNFVEAMIFVNGVANLAESAQHHPDIEINYNKVHLSLITHDAGNVVTDKDRNLASQIDTLSSR